MTKAKKIMDRLEELEKIARRNRDKWDDTSLTEYLDNEEAEEYKKLLNEWNKIEVKKWKINYQKQ